MLTCAARTALFHCLQDIAHARLEFEITCFGAVQDLLNKTGGSAHLCGARLCGSGERGAGGHVDERLGLGCAGSVKVVLFLSSGASGVVQDLPDKAGYVCAHGGGGWPGGKGGVCVGGCFS
jgi:hypothetical protein